MIVIGLTGGMASGKSACARYLKSRGVLVLDADEVSRELTRGNNLGARRIKEELGERFFRGGELDRAETARWAFASPQNTEKLNSIIHPLVISRLEEEIKRLEREGQRAVVLDCPLLFESGLDKILKKVGEESAETIIAAKNGDKQEVIEEISDLMYHLLVMLHQLNIDIGEVEENLEKRSLKTKNLKASKVVDKNT